MSDKLDTPGLEARRFRSYPEYKNSGAEWMEKIPAHWEIQSLKRICRLAYGDSLQSDEREEGDIEVFGSNGSVGFHNRANTIGSCLVIGRKGSFGKVNYSSKSVFAIDTTFFIDERFTFTVLRWLFYVLTWLRLDTYTKDSAIPGLDRQDAYGCSVPLCPLEEQCVLSAFLDRETAKIDALIEKKERLIELLQEKRTALITQAVTKGLDLTVPMKDSGVGWLGQIPTHWEAIALKYLVPEITVGIVVTPAKYYIDDGIPCLRSLNISGGIIDLNELVYISEEANELHRKSKVFENDIVVVRTGQAGTAAIIPEQLDGINCIDLLIIRRSDHLLPGFVYYYLNSGAAKSQAANLSVGAIQAHYNTATLAKLIIPAVPLAEQAKIVSYLDEKIRSLDELLRKIDIAVNHLREYRMALISAAVIGKIDVREARASAQESY